MQAVHRTMFSYRDECALKLTCGDGDHEAEDDQPVCVPRLSTAQLYRDRDAVAGQQQWSSL